MKPIFNYKDWDKANNLFKYKDVQSVIIGSSIIEKKPEIIFAIPAYRRAEDIECTIKSILNQRTRYKYIVMVVDDSGDDVEVEEKVLNLIKRHNNIILYKNKVNLGQAANWNRCIELAWTNWLVIIHDDDMVCENYLEEVFPIARNSKIAEIGVFQYKYDKLIHIDEKAKNFNEKQSFAQKILSILRWGAPFRLYPKDIFQFIVPSPGCWLINRDEAKKNGGFNDNFGVTLDGIFHFKNIYYSTVVIVPKFLMIRRVEENTFLKQNSQIEVINMLYYFGIEMLKQYSGFKAKYYKFLLDISTIYLGNGIKVKYDGDFNLDELLISYGINRKLVKLPKKLIFILNCILLSKLLFRKRIRYEK